MKKLSLLLALVFVLSAFTACGGENTVTPEEATEEIWVITENYRNGELFRTYEYDEKGNIVRKLSYDEGEVSRSREEFFDDKGNNIKTVMINDSGEETVVTREFDKNGNEIKTVEEEDGVPVVREYKYNKNGKITLYKYTKNDILREKRTFEYDEEGRPISFTSYTRTGEIDYVYEYEYNENGDKTAERTVAPDGSIASETLYIYDSEYKQVEMIYTQDGAESMREKYFYDEKGNLIEEELYFYGEPDGGIKYEYDSENRVIKVEYFSADGEYESIDENFYDENGNLVRKRFTSNPDDKKPRSAEFKYIKLTVTPSKAKELAEDMEIILL